MKRDRDTEIETGKHTDGGTETNGQQTSLDGSADVRTPAAPILAITGESIGKLVREHADYHSKKACKDGQGTEQIPPGCPEGMFTYMLPHVHAGVMRHT